MTTGRLQKTQRANGCRRGGGFCQSAQCRRRLAQATGPAHRGQASAGRDFLRPRAKSRAGAFRPTHRGDVALVGETGIQDAGEDLALPFRDGTARGDRRIGPSAPRFPYETDGAVIKLNDLALRERAGLHRQSPALGHRLQIRAEQARHDIQRHHRPGRAHGRVDAGGGTGAGFSGRQHDQPRHPAQRGRNQAEGHPHRRHGDH